MNIVNAYDDPRFNHEIDEKVIKTKSDIPFI